MSTTRLLDHHRLFLAGDEEAFSVLAALYLREEAGAEDVAQDIGSEISAARRVIQRLFRAGYIKVSRKDLYRVTPYANQILLRFGIPEIGARSLASTCHFAESVREFVGAAIRVRALAEPDIQVSYFQRAQALAECEAVLWPKVSLSDSERERINLAVLIGVDFDLHDVGVEHLLTQVKSVEPDAVGGQESTGTNSPLWEELEKHLLRAVDDVNNCNVFLSHGLDRTRRADRNVAVGVALGRIVTILLHHDSDSTFPLQPSYGGEIKGIGYIDSWNDAAVPSIWNILQRRMVVEGDMCPTVVNLSKLLADRLSESLTRHWSYRFARAGAEVPQRTRYDTESNIRGLIQNIGVFHSSIRHGGLDAIQTPEITELRAALNDVLIEIEGTLSKRREHDKE